jgi:dihydroorotate dehydrogenase electron transfer subunit
VSDGRVLAPFGRRAAVITARERHGAYVVIHCEDPAGPRPQAGQFYMLSAAERWGGGDGERPFLPRAFSVLRAPEAGHDLQFLLEDVGPGTRRLGELAPGEALLLVGPLGQGFTHGPGAASPALLVGGGVGIAPLAILQDQVESPSGADSIGGIARGAIPPVTVLLGFRDEARARGGGLLRAARVATDDGSVGHHGLITELLTEELAAGSPAQVYACGPPAMLEAVRAICGQAGTPAQLALESGMACGFGACFGCVVPTTEGYVRLCTDGPVLDAARLETALVAGAGH